MRKYLQDKVVITEPAFTELFIMNIYCTSMYILIHDLQSIMNLFTCIQNLAWDLNLRPLFHDDGTMLDKRKYYYVPESKQSEPSSTTHIFSIFHLQHDHCHFSFNDQYLCTSLQVLSTYALSVKKFSI